MKKNILLNIFYQALIVIVPLITAPYISRILLTDGVGIYSYTTSLVTYFTMFSALGTLSYGTREIARSRDDKKETSKLFWEIELLTVFTSLISLFIWGIVAILYKAYSFYLLILSFMIISSMFDISWLYAGLEKFKYSIVVNSICKIIGTIMIFVFVKNHNDLWKYLLIYSSTSLLGNLSMWLFLPKVLSKTKISLSNIKKHLKETLIYFIPTIATTIYTLLDKTLIGVLIQGETVQTLSDGTEKIVKISEIENGYYEQATKIIGILKIVGFVGINGVMESRSGYLFKNNDLTAVKKLTNITFNITLLLSIGAACGAFAIANNFIPLFFGEGYDKTILLIYILSIIVPVICISNVLGCTYYTPSGNRKKSSIYLIIGSIINLILNIPLIIFFKSIGAAIASIIAEVVISYLYIKNCPYINSIYIFKMIWKKLISGLVMLLLVYLLGKYMPINNIYILLFIQIIFGIIIYFVFIFVLKDESAKIIIELKKGRNKDGKTK